MNYYKLENKQLDADFLAGKMVACKATVPHKQAKDIGAEGQSIVIALSTGQKYKGKILAFRHVVIDQYAVGELEIIRA